jgi:dipeptidyl aminopeptidase/acylaminoacyl peptidase
MTTFDRFEREIPELMAELAPPRVPDYFDDMLQQAARTRQRPAWSAPERWIPMGVIARTQPMRPVPWRLIAIGVALLLLAGAALLYVGSRPHIPAPFGPARNGQIAFGTFDGEIMTIDPSTGASTALIAGPTFDVDPWFSNDGTKFAFDRLIGMQRALFIAKSDGTGVRQLVGPAASIDGFDWSADGERILISREGDPRGLITILNARDGSATTFTLDLDVSYATWRPGSDQLVLAAETTSPAGPTHGFYLVGSDGVGLRPIVASTIILNQPTISADGSKLAYSTWETGAEGRTHVIDIDSGVESDVDFAPDFAFTDLSPVFSPDATKIVVERSDTDGYRLTILPVDGQGQAIPLGVHHPDMTNGARVTFSPDGTKVLATYQDDGTTWLLDVTTGNAVEKDWPIVAQNFATWQRLAP